MSRSLKANLIKYGIATTLGGLLAYFYVSVRDFGAQPLMEQYRILCDAFTIPGMLFVLFALLLTVSNEGALDGVGYCVKQALRMLAPKGLGGEKYDEYLERRRKNRVKGYGFLYVVGGAFMAVAGVFMALFYSLYNG